jgi:hypothetical protein
MLHNVELCKKFAISWKSEGWLLYSEEPAACPIVSHTDPAHVRILTYILIFTHLRLGRTSAFFLSFFLSFSCLHPQILYAFLFSPMCVPHVDSTECPQNMCAVSQVLYSCMTSRKFCSCDCCNAARTERTFCFDPDAFEHFWWVGVSSCHDPVL